jgi:hypothetical protein
VDRHIIPEKLHENLVSGDKKLQIDKIMQKYQTIKHPPETKSLHNGLNGNTQGYQAQTPN